MTNKALRLFWGPAVLLIAALLCCTPGAALAAEDGPFISELMASYAPRYADNGYDWLEIENPARESVSLAGWTLERGKTRYTFPAGVKVPARGVLLVTCDEEGGRLDNSVNAALSLKLSGGTVTLYNAEGALADTFTYPGQYGNISCGRLSAGGEVLYLEEATPGKKNTGSGYTERSEKPVTEPAGGMYDAAVTVKAVQGEGVLRYTLDGSLPTEKSKVFPEEGITFSKTGVLRLRRFEEGRLPSETLSESYIIGFSTACPVVSLICDPEYLTGGDGLFVSGGGRIPNWERDWEYPIHVEYFDASSALCLSQDAGFRIMGEISRQYTQKAMVLTARKAYSGQDRLAFSPFTEGEAAGFTEFKSVALRSAGSEGMMDGFRFHDAFLGTLAEGTHVLYQQCTPVAVYMNGKLSGHYNIREKVNKYFIAQHEGITDEETIDSIDLLTRTGQVVQGDNREYLELRDYVKSHDLNDPEAFAYVEERVDLDSYYDHCALEIICGNEDINNIKFYKVPGGKWKWILYDLDTAMNHLNRRPLEWLLVDKNKTPEHDFDHFLFSALMQVPEARSAFLARMGELLRDKFAPEFLSARLDEWKARFAPVMEYQFEARPSLKKSVWNESVELFRKKLRTAPKHAAEVTRDLLKMTEEETEAYFGAFLHCFEK